jgi:ubiquinone/menaquinone biosynthesis C-methylase UbiE
MPVDPHAERAFGSRADAYDRHRPGWPPEAVERALSELGLGRDSTVVDLAAGTGKLTRELVPRTGRVVAVEPSADMLRKLSEDVPAAEALDGTADAIPLAGASVDGVLVAEAFHWFATSDSVAEIARVLRPGGGLALLWNLYQWGEEELGEEEWLDEVGALFGEHLAPAVAAADRNRTESWRGAFDGSPFGDFNQFEVAHELRTDADGLIAHIGTWSHTRMLEDAARAEFLRELKELLLRAHPTPGDIPLRFRTQVHWTRRA